MDPKTIQDEPSVSHTSPGELEPDLRTLLQALPTHAHMQALPTRADMELFVTRVEEDMESLIARMEEIWRWYEEKSSN